MMLKKELKQDKAFASDAEEAFLNLIRSAGILSEPIDHILRENSLSQTGYNILRILDGAGGEGLNCADIRERMVSRVPDVTRLVDRLVKLGMAERQRGKQDRRQVLVSITKEGAALARDLKRPLETTVQDLFSDFTQEDFANLNRLLVKARSSLINHEPATIRSKP